MREELGSLGLGIRSLVSVPLGANDLLCGYQEHSSCSLGPRFSVCTLPWLL